MSVDTLNADLATLAATVREAIPKIALSTRESEENKRSRAHAALAELVARATQAEADREPCFVCGEKSCRPIWDRHDIKRFREEEERNLARLREERDAAREAYDRAEDERLQLRAAFNRLQDQILEASVPGSSAADVDGAEKRESAARGHHESVGERQGRQHSLVSKTWPETARQILADSQPEETTT